MALSPAQKQQAYRDRQKAKRFTAKASTPAEVLAQRLRGLLSESPELLPLASRWIEQKEQAVSAHRQMGIVRNV